MFPATPMGRLFASLAVLPVARGDGPLVQVPGLQWDRKQCTLSIGSSKKYDFSTDLFLHGWKVDNSIALEFGLRLKDGVDFWRKSSRKALGFC